MTVVGIILHALLIHSVGTHAAVFNCTLPINSVSVGRGVHHKEQQTQHIYYIYDGSFNTNVDKTGSTLLSHDKHKLRLAHSGTLHPLLTNNRLHA